LQVVREQGDLEPVGLLTTGNEAFDRVSMHGVRRELVEAQSRVLGLPLWWVALPWPCPNEEYERRMATVIGEARAQDIDLVVFGDLFLEDVRDYRVEKLRGSGIEPVFPIWCGGGDTLEVARRMVTSGLRAVVTCVDPAQLDSAYAGRDFDSDFLAELPGDVDPLGEHGEFHTFCHAGPMFDEPIRFGHGDIVDRGGFTYADLIPAS
jgi:diphthamide synthase (EF-2-diphthine--ammonia ligase)